MLRRVHLNRANLRHHGLDITDDDATLARASEGRILHDRALRKDEMSVSKGNMSNQKTYSIVGDFVIISAPGVERLFEIEPVTNQSEETKQRGAVV